MKLYYFILLQFLWMSGGLVFFEGYSSIFLILYLLSSFYFFSKKSALNLGYNYGIWIVLLCWVLFCDFIVNSYPEDNIFVSILILPLSTLFVVSKLDFNDFRIHLLKVTNWLMGVSLIVHLFHNLGLIPASYISLGKVSGKMSLYFFNTEWGSYETFLGTVYRFSSIYWEVGQLQIVLIYLLVLYTDWILTLVKSRKYKDLIKKFSIIVFSIIMTGSTTGYLTFMYYLLLIVLYSTSKKQIKYLPIYSLFFIGVSFLVFNSSAIQEKLDQKESTATNTSYAIRLNNTIGCYNITMANPLFGLGSSSKELKRELMLNDSLTSSTGWLRTSASYGVPILFFLLYFMYKGLRRMKLGVPSLCLLVVLIISQMNEYYTFFPYLFLYIFKFKSYSKPYYLR